MVTSIEDVTSEATAEEYDAAEVLTVLAHVITTTRGACTIDMRLNSNGYYGGSLDVETVEAVPNGATVLEDF